MLAVGWKLNWLTTKALTHSLLLDLASYGIAVGSKREHPKSKRAKRQKEAVWPLRILPQIGEICLQPYSISQSYCTD
jgi:hypothetical protein